MKKKFVTILITIVAGIWLGYLFLLTCLLGFLASKYVAGGTSGEKGRIGSIIIPFRRWAIHLHHWLYSLGLMGLSSAIGLYLLSPTVTYGLLGGSVFQGIYCYNDWHIIAISRYKTERKRPKSRHEGQFKRSEASLNKAIPRHRVAKAGGRETIS
jgi:hypothetical protein